MPEPNPVIEAVTTLVCPWCGTAFEDKLLYFDMPSIGHTVKAAPNPLCPDCRLVAAQRQAAEDLARQQRREAEWAGICPVECWCQL